MTAAYKKKRWRGDVSVIQVAHFVHFDHWSHIFEDHFFTDETVHRVSSQFQEVKLMSCPTPKDSEEDCGISSSVPVLDPTSSSSILGGPSKHSSPSKPAFLCPSPPGSVAPNIYAKSTSPNCGISLQAEFFLSPLTTAVNYNPVARTWVTARRSDIETQRKEERGLKRAWKTCLCYMADTMRTRMQTSHATVHLFGRWRRESKDE